MRVALDTTLLPATGNPFAVLEAGCVNTFELGTHSQNVLIPPCLGRQVEVLAPERLREMVDGYRRAEFDAIP